MDKQQGMVIVDGLREAQTAGAAVVELSGEQARDFNWVTVEERKELLGSFCVEIGKKFFVLLASTPRSTEDFQFMVYEKLDLDGHPAVDHRPRLPGPGDLDSELRGVIEKLANGPGRAEVLRHLVDQVQLCRDRGLGHDHHLCGRGVIRLGLRAVLCRGAVRPGRMQIPAPQEP